MNLKNIAEEYVGKTNQQESQDKKLNAELQLSRSVKQSARVPPSTDGIGEIPATSLKQVLRYSGGNKKVYSDVTRASIEKRYTLMIKSKFNQSPKTIKNVLK